MRKKVEENLGAVGATTVALVFVVAYSLWGMTILHNHKAAHAVAGTVENLAVK
jgi:hypothetical protein